MVRYDGGTINQDWEHKRRCSFGKGIDEGLVWGDSGKFPLVVCHMEWPLSVEIQP